MSRAAIAAPSGPARSLTPTVTSRSASAPARTTIWNDSASPRAAARLAVVPLPARSSGATRASDDSTQAVTGLAAAAAGAHARAQATAAIAAPARPLRTVHRPITSTPRLLASYRARAGPGRARDRGKPSALVPAAERFG